LIWSGLESFSALSGGKYSRVAFFDGKSEITEYAKQSGVPLAVVKAGYYGTTVFDALRKQPDGSYILGLPMPAATIVPFIDVKADYGMYVRAAIEDPTLGAGSEIQSGTLVSYGEMAELISAASGKKITYVELDREAYIAGAHTPEFGAMLADMYQAYAACGYYGPKEITSSSILPRKPHSYSEFLEANPVQL